MVVTMATNSTDVHTANRAFVNTTIRTPGVIHLFFFLLIGNDLHAYQSYAIKQFKTP